MRPSCGGSWYDSLVEAIVEATAELALRPTVRPTGRRPRADLLACRVLVHGEHCLPASHPSSALTALWVRRQLPALSTRALPERRFSEALPESLLEGELRSRCCAARSGTHDGWLTTCCALPQDRRTG